MYLGKHIFILGHMRSRSSLLTHVLMNHKAIYGLGESNKKYQNTLDLIKMRIKTRLKHRMISPRYFTFIDQINHNAKTPNLELVKSYAQVIILAREPKASFRSIQSLTATYYNEWPHTRIEEYYLSRLAYLLKVKDLLANTQVLLVNSDAIVNHTENTLRNLTEFLDLKDPLTPDYKTYTFSGKRGDPSGNIQEGVIKSEEENRESYSGAISQECYDLFHQLIRDEG